MKLITSISAFSVLEQDTITVAVKALDQAYAPYSRFRVGAAILLSNNEICIGSNQENASYPLCMCGERVAAYHAISKYPKETFKVVAIICKNELKKLESIGSPCGACRQVLLEYEQRFSENIKIILCNDEATEFHVFDSAASLLPYSFDGSCLSNDSA